MASILFVIPLYRPRFLELYDNPGLIIYYDPETKERKVKNIVLIKILKLITKLRVKYYYRVMLPFNLLIMSILL